MCLYQTRCIVNRNDDEQCPIVFIVLSDAFEMANVIGAYKTSVMK